MNTTLELTDGGELLPIGDQYLKLNRAGKVPPGVYKVTSEIVEADVEEYLHRIKPDVDYIVESINGGLLIISRQPQPKLASHIDSIASDYFADAQHSERGML